MVAFIVPNHDLAKRPVGAFQVTVDEVEQRSGLDFFAELDDIEESRLESRSGRSGTGAVCDYPAVTAGEKNQIY